MNNQDNPGKVISWIHGLQTRYERSVKFPTLTKQESEQFHRQTTSSNLANVRLIAVLLILEDILLLAIVGILSIVGSNEEYSTFVQISWTNTIIFVPIALFILIFVKVPDTNQVATRHRIKENLIIAILFAGVVISCLRTGNSNFYMVAVLLFSLVISKQVKIMAGFYLIFLTLFLFGMLSQGWDTDRIVATLAESLRITAIGFLIFWIRQRNNMLIFQREKLISSQNVELTKANSVLKDLSMLDPLTQIPNRRSFDKHFEEEWKRAVREKTSMGLLIIDIDHFKKYNDKYGHQAGDECLKSVASSLQGRIQRMGDMVARYGGEEFVVVLPNNDEQGAKAFGEKIRTGVLNLKIPHKGSSLGRITISVGVASFQPNKDSSTDSLLQAADQALYLAKGKGRNQVQVAENIS